MALLLKPVQEMIAVEIWERIVIFIVLDEALDFERNCLKFGCSEFVRLSSFVSCNRDVGLSRPSGLWIWYEFQFYRMTDK